MKKYNRIGQLVKQFSLTANPKAVDFLVYSSKRIRHSYFLGDDIETKYIWGRNAHYMDQAITAIVQNKLRATLDERVWGNRLTYL